MWWIQTTPPRDPSVSGIARYASISSLPCPVMVIVSARIASGLDEFMTLLLVRPQRDTERVRLSWGDWEGAPPEPNVAQPEHGGSRAKTGSPTPPPPPGASPPPKSLSPNT